MKGKEDCKWIIPNVLGTRPQNGRWLQGPHKRIQWRYPIYFLEHVVVAGSHSQPEFLEFMMQWLFDIYLSKMASHLMIFFLGFRHKIIDSRNDEQSWCSSQPVFRQLHSQSGHLETFRIDQPFELMMKFILNNVEIILVGCPSPDIALPRQR